MKLADHALRDFWRFVRLRHQAWAAKHKLAPAPDDPVIARVKFTNMWRALDRGTLFAVYEILPLPPEDRLWAALMYRAMNRIDAFRALVPPRLSLDAGLFLHALGQWRALGGKVFTGVYCSSATLQGDMLDGPGVAMDRRLAAYARELLSNAYILNIMLDGVASRELAFEEMRDATKHTRLGPFAVNQALLDLTIRSDNTWPDDWCHLGPGAKEGLRLLGMRPNLEALNDLAAQQPEIPWAPVENATRRPVRLELADVEHALCEWQKYERACAGGHVKNEYVPSPTKSDDWMPVRSLPSQWGMP